MLGAVWYGVLGKQWMEATGLKADENGRPITKGKPATPYIIALIAQILVAGMMRHVFMMSGIDGATKGLLSGLGIGLFFITAWMALNYAYSDRPRKLVFIDGGYATLGCGVMGLVLGIF